MKDCVQRTNCSFHCDSQSTETNASRRPAAQCYITAGAAAIHTSVSNIREAWSGCLKKVSSLTNKANKSKSYLKIDNAEEKGTEIDGQ